jgi:hypothetical protein
MWKRICTGIDDYRIWYKITYQRGRILATDREAWRATGTAASLWEA